MNSFHKQLIFITLGVAIITTGGLGIWAVANRGADPYIYIKLDEGYGSTAYDQQSNANGTISGAVWKTEQECRVGSCLYFDGVNDSISIDDFDLE